MSKIITKLMENPLGGELYIKNGINLLTALIASLFFALIMMSVYKLCHDSLTYNKKFNITLMMLSVSSTILMALIENNPMFSLGALGALSICRIRTNTHDPRDLGFVFWALSIGIASSLGAFAVNLISAFSMSTVMLLLGRTKKKKDELTMIIRGSKEQLQNVQSVFNETPGSIIMSKNIFSDSFELVYSLSVPQDEEEKLLLIFNNMEGIKGVNVLAPETQVA